MKKNDLAAAAQYDPNIATSIDTGCDGRFRYSPLFNAYPAIEISMSGKRQKDRQLAGGQKGDGMNCHHIFEVNFNLRTCHVQLVPELIHRATIPHRGAVYQWDMRNREKYRTIKESNINQYKISINRKYDIEEIRSFESLYKVKLPQDIIDIYSKQAPIDALYKIKDTEIIEMDSVTPLFEDKNKGIVGVDSLWGQVPFGDTKFYDQKNDFLVGNFFCISKDCCGNFLYLEIPSNKLYFYDHETNEMYPVDAV